MPVEVIIPSSYSEWCHCIENQCRERLTHAYCASRFTALHHASDSHTRSFLTLYGRSHLDRVPGWFERAHAEATA